MARYLALVIWLGGCMLVAQGNPSPAIQPCPDDPLFTVIPMEPDHFLAFRPLGFVSVPVHLFPAKHSAFSMALPGEAAAERPVRFPGDLWVTEIWSTLYPNGQSGYQVHFQPCAQVRGYFNHLKDISAELKAAFDIGEKRCQDFTDLTGTIVKCQARVLVKVFTGDFMGVSGDSSAGVDFGLADFRKEPEGLVNLDHYPYDYPYYVSPVDYYASGLKALFETKLASIDGRTPRTAEPKSGSYRPDVPGTAQGNWFFPGIYLRSVTDYSSAVALVSDYVDPSQPLFSVGTSLEGVRMGLYSVTHADAEVFDRQVNIPFRRVTADGNTYCYEGFLQGRTTGGLPLGRIDGALLLRLPTGTTLEIERQGRPGDTCESLRPWQFTSRATRYER